MAKKNMEIYASKGTHESGNFAELTVEKKAVGKYKWYKILRVLILVGWITGCLAAMFLIKSGVQIVIIMLGAILLASGSFIIWGLTSPLGLTEYRYSILSGDMIFDKFIGGRYRKDEILKIHVAEMSLIAPYHGDKQSEATASDIVNTFDFSSTLSEPDVYFALFENDGQKSVVLFDATQKALKVLKFLNKDAIIMKDVRR